MEDSNRSTDGAISKPKLEKVRKSNARGKPKGLPKSGGRKAKPIEDTSNWDKILHDNFFEIPNEAIKLYFNGDTSNSLKFAILQFLATYTTPAIKPTDKVLPTSSEPESNDQDILSIVGEK